MGNYCSVPHCIRQASYYFEWYKLNERSHYPETVHRKYVCDDKSHLLAAVDDKKLGPADALVDILEDKEDDELLVEILRGFQLDLKFSKS